MDFCNLKAQYSEYRTEIDTAMAKVLDESRYVFGAEIRDLENKLSAFTGSRAIACANGTDALVLALMAAGIKKGDEVITTPFTFIATAEAIALVGATPVFCDISPLDFNLDPSQIEAKINAKTKAILPVSLYGQTAEMELINQIAAKYNLIVIEDAAQSFGALYNGKRSCNLSPLATTSFFPAKPLGCYGDGGAVFCQDAEMETLLRQLCNHGQSERYIHQRIGLNSRLDTLQAAVLLVKMKHYEREIAKRNEIAARYTNALKEKFQTPHIHSHNTSVWAQYTILSPERDTLQQKLQKTGIPTAIHYPKPLHLQPCFGNLAYKIGDFPVAERLAQEVISLPMSAYLSRDEQDQVIEGCLSF